MSSVPLEERTIPVEGVNGIRKDIPAISPTWKQNRSWRSYVPPPSREEISITGAKDAWVANAERVEQDLLWLLRLPCNKFWSQILHDQSMQAFLENMLQQYPREYDLSQVDEVQQNNVKILHKLFLVFLRLCTYKESPTDFFSPTYFANMIYDKFILDLPKIIDICSLFRPCNREITKKMIENVFKVQQKYLDDLLTAGETLGQAFRNASEQCQTMSMTLPSRQTVDGFSDLVGFVIDISSSAFSLLDIYPTAARSLQFSGFDMNLAAFYHSTIVGLQEILDKYIESKVLSTEESRTFSALVQLARHRTILSFRTIVEHNCLTPLLSDQPDCDKDQMVEEFLSIFTNVLQERTFLEDYNAKFPISEDFQIFEQSEVHVDPTRKHYILDALCDSKQVSAFDRIQQAGEKEKNSTAQVVEPEPQGAAALPQQSKRRPEVEIESMISNVRDLLPYLGEGFVEKCLEHYDFKVEEVVNAILEGNLAPHLIELDQSMARQPREPQPDPVMSRGVYDNDEFDVNSRDDIDVSKVHRGKKNKLGSSKTILDDKSDINSMRDRFSRLGIVSDLEVMVGDQGEYDDEYDDTYDDAAIGQEEPDSRDDGAGGRSFVLPVALGGGKIGRVVNEDEEQEEDEDETDPKKRMDFVRNPEEMRQEHERRRQEKMNRNVKKHPHQPVRDVVGKPKGQGQDKQVLINRARKNTNKGKSHRIGAEKKMAKGMF